MKGGGVANGGKEHSFVPLTNHNPVEPLNSQPTTNAPEYDFFVSYARADDATGWISRFVEELLAEHRKFAQGRELKPFFDRHAITTGADWQLYLAEGVAHSKLFLAFISPAYFAS